MIVRSIFAPIQALKLTGGAGSHTASRFYMRIPVRPARSEKGAIHASLTACIAASKGLFMKILGQNDCFFM